MIYIGFMWIVLIFAISLITAVYLLEADLRNINYKKIFIALVIYLIPKCFVDHPLHFLLDTAFCIGVITDIYEYSVFTIVPLVLYVFALCSILYEGQFLILQNILLQSCLLFFIYYAIVLFSRKYFSQDGFGKGDFYFLLSLIPYFNIENFFLLFFLASSVGLIYALFVLILIGKKTMGVPFIPCLYVAASLMNNINFYTYICSLLY